MRKIAPTILLYFLCSGLNGCNQTPGSSGSYRPTAGTNDIAQANLNLGIAYLRTGEFEKSLENLLKARAADKNYPPIYNALGVLYQRLGNKVKAEEYYLHALGLNGSDSSTLNNYGQFLCQESRFDEAEVTFLKAANNPLYATPEIAFSNAGTCAMEQGELDTAETYFRDALKKIPKSLLPCCKWLKYHMPLATTCRQEDICNDTLRSVPIQQRVFGSGSRLKMS